MKKTLIIANWKSNKTKYEAKNWLEEVFVQALPESVEVVILPPFTLLDVINGYKKVNDLPIGLGAQDISPYDQGAYTGEIAGNQIKEFGDYVLIGHSERRLNFSESDEIIYKKIEKALENSLKPIICISNFEQARGMEFAKQAIFVFEPPSAISTNSGGVPEDLSKVSEFSQKFGATFANQLIYGGSINSQNVKEYLNIPGISGVLVGAESLNPKSFSDVIKNAI